jgi:hypothetical protein
LSFLPSTASVNIIVGGSAQTISLTVNLMSGTDVNNPGSAITGAAVSLLYSPGYTTVSGVTPASYKLVVPTTQTAGTARITNSGSTKDFNFNVNPTDTTITVTAYWGGTTPPGGLDTTTLLLIVGGIGAVGLIAAAAAASRGGGGDYYPPKRGKGRSRERSQETW